MHRFVWRIATGVALLGLAGCSRGENAEVGSAAGASPPSQVNREDDVLTLAAAAIAGEEAKAAEGEPPQDVVAQAPIEAPVVAQLDDHPFPRRVEMPEFPRDLEWLNASGPIRIKDLRGKFVLLDFWTYCCINCIHILPELKKLEQKYPNELVVIGVHSAKFDTEKETKSIEEAILRYEIEHPVVNDADHVVWDSLGVESWPTILLVDPEGNAVWGRPGEVTFEQLDVVMKHALPHYRAKGLIDARPLRFDLASYKQEQTPLRFPGKVLADEAGGRLFIADSNHNRLVVASLDGKLQATIGSGAIGRADGDYAKCSFNKPQGMALFGSTLYVADTENHLLRAVDLDKQQVTTIAGVGVQGRGFADIDDVRPLKAELNSPWDLWVHGEDLFIAMAGPHQIWKMPLDGTVIGPYAGSGREDILDGPLLPRQPYAEDFSAFAQPSGLASDGERLFVADSEGSSIRAVPFDPKLHVKTLVGTNELPYGRLFTFGDVDGPARTARLQHPLGVVYHEGVIYIADTYNNKVKALDIEEGEVRTVAGTGEGGATDDPATFDEPAGISLGAGKLFVADTNNHAIRTIDLASGKVSTLSIEGLAPPTPPVEAKKPNFAAAVKARVRATKIKPVDGKVSLRVELKFPRGWKINPLAPMAYYIEANGEKGPIDRSELGKLVKLDSPSPTFDVALPAASEGKDTLTVSLNYYYCQEGGEGLCKVGQVAFNVPLTITPQGADGPATLRHAVTP